MVDLSRMLGLARCWLFGLLVGLAAAQQAAVARRLNVWLVGDEQSARSQALLATLRGAGLQVRVLHRADCTPEALRTAHVVVVDWPATDPLGPRLPLGPYERWDRPTVFVGSCGARFAESWGLPTPTTMAAMAAADRGPEMQAFPPTAPARSVVWRQGNLVHFDDDPAEPLAESERAWFVQTVLAATTFVSDRPIFAHGVPAGAEPSPTERERRQRVYAGMPRDPTPAQAAEALRQAIERLDGPEAKVAEAWLVDAVPGSQPLGTSRNNWRNWFRSRLAALVWDPLSVRWRVDELAFWRQVESSGLRGDARAEGAPEDAAAAALAAKVVQRHGGAAFGDLKTFSCWLGERFCQWDRRAGVLRVENFAEIPAGNLATPWEVAVFDTTADADLVRGGGPEPRPFVSARGTYRELVEQLFLPVLLLEPGVTVRRAPDEDTDGKQALHVRLMLRGMDPKALHVLFVDPATGAVDFHHRVVGARVQRGFRIDATAACGPLLLPAEARIEQGRNRRPITFAEAKWNPELPADLATATGRRATPRDK
ncbi:MAG: hypothetical protein JNK15_17525 [Planctomycetes bacterium]|nr:hypothetical protein [Planctomycetota bacterium]